MFGPDRFHPSARGYAQAAFAVLPSACAALGLLPELDEAERSRGILPVDRAAVVAAETPGTEVSRAGEHVSGHETGTRGRWAALIRGPFRLRGGHGPEGQAAEVGATESSRRPGENV